MIDLIKNINAIMDNQLTETEATVLKMDAKGMTAKEIADTLGYTRQQIYNIIKSAKDKIDAKN